MACSPKLIGGLPRVIPGFSNPGFSFIYTHLPVAACPLVAALLGSYFQIAYGIQLFDEAERS